MNYEKLKMKDKINEKYSEWTYDGSTEQLFDKLYKIASKHAKNRQEFDEMYSMSFYYAGGDDYKSKYPIVEAEMRECVREFYK